MNSTPLVVWVLREIKGGHRHGNHGCQWGSLAQSRMSLSGGTCLSQGQDAPAIQRRVFSLGSHVQRCLGEWRPHTFPSMTPVNFPGDTQSWVEASLWNHTPWSWGQASHVHPKAPCDLGATPGSLPSSPGAADSLLVLHLQPGEHKAAMSNADSAVRLPFSSPAERTRRDTAGGGGEASGWGVWGGRRGGEGREAVSFPQSASRALRCLHNAWVQIYTSSPNDRVCLNTHPQACCGYTRVSVFPRLYKACL